LVHVTVVPTEMTSGFVPNAVVVSVRALFGIDTAADALEVGGGVVEDGLGEEELLPHAAAVAARTATIRIPRNAITPP
jgi:hypothetical protein